MEDMVDLRQYIQIIIKRSWIIVLVTAVCVISSGIISFFVLDNIYEASTTIMVSQARDDKTNSLQYNDILLNQKLVKTYTQIVKSDRVLEKVIEKLNLDMSSNALRSKVSVNSVSDTEIIRIMVKDQDPNIATELANTVAVVFMGEIGSIMKMDNVQFIDTAKVPSVPVAPRPMKNMSTAAMLGIMVSTFVVLLIEYLDNTIKTTEDIEGHLGLPVLGSIPVFDE